MKNTKSNLDKTRTKLDRDQLIADLKAKALKGGAKCPPPFGNLS